MKDNSIASYHHAYCLPLLKSSLVEKEVNRYFVGFQTTRQQVHDHVSDMKHHRNHCRSHLTFQNVNDV